MWQDVGLIAVIIGNGVTLLLWWLNRNEQGARIYKSQQDTISALIDDVAQLRAEVKAVQDELVLVRQERDEYAEAVMILYRQLKRENIDPEWKPKNSVK